MPRTGSTPTIVPYGADQTAYLVVDRFVVGLGTVYRETEIERTDLETIITDLLSGQFNDPVRVVAFNTLEHWSRDVSKDVALEIRTRCDFDGENVPEAVRDLSTPTRVRTGRSRYGSRVVRRRPLRPISPTGPRRTRY
jgi:hypothetical protein